MRTVKEISAITGISVRTLHYYDEIGLLRPTEKSEAGYRLYDDKALETLQQILFFREFEIPLKDIKAIMDDPALDRDRVLQMQKRMLEAKKARLERLISGIDHILKGDKEMDFAIFNRTELDELFRSMVETMPEELRQSAIEEFGGLDRWREHYLQVMSGEKAQKRWAKMVEWYGGKDAYLSAAKNPFSREVAESYKAREDHILRRLIEKRDCDLDPFAVRELIGEYGFVMKQLLQMKEEEGMMLSLARSYRSELVAPEIDRKYGPGASAFFALAIEAFYRR